MFRVFSLNFFLLETILTNVLGLIYPIFRRRSEFTFVSDSDYPYFTTYQWFPLSIKSPPDETGKLWKCCPRTMTLDYFKPKSWKEHWQFDFFVKKSIALSAPNPLWDFGNCWHSSSSILNQVYILHSCTLKDADLRLPDGGVDALEDGDGEGGGLARAGLRLGDHVSPLIQLHLAQMLNKINK